MTFLASVAPKLLAPHWIDEAGQPRSALTIPASTTRTRDLGSLVTDGQLLSPRKAECRCETLQVALGVPAYQIRNTGVDVPHEVDDPGRHVALRLRNPDKGDERDRHEEELDATTCTCLKTPRLIV